MPSVKRTGEVYEQLTIQVPISKKGAASSFLTNCLKTCYFCFTASWRSDSRFGAPSWQRGLFIWRQNESESEDDSVKGERKAAEN